MQQFTAEAQTIHQNLPANISDPDSSENAMVYNVEIISTQLPVGSELTATIHLLADVPDNPSLRLFSAEGAWQSFDGSGGEIYHANAGTDGCPAANDSNYKLAWGYNSDGSLASGAQCLRFKLKDGGTNDIDGLTMRSK